MSIDIKPQRSSVVRPLLDVLDRHHAESYVTLASFHHHQLVRTRALGWSGRTALSRIEIAALRFLPLSVSRALIRGQAAQIPRRFVRIRLDGDSLLERCRRLGIRADFWVVNDPTEARELLDRGATGIMTDHPAMIASAIF